MKRMKKLREDFLADVRRAAKRERIRELDADALARVTGGDDDPHGVFDGGQINPVP